jgi:digeranylgeranylglycerophospholipid reductase
MKLDDQQSAIDNGTRNPVSSTRHRKCDILVIGAGPAGSMAARAAAQQGVDVLMIEKRQEIGVPVRCAEGVSKRALAELTELDPKWICAEIHGGRIHSPDGTFITIDEPGSGLVLERRIFDRELAAQAVKSGAEVWVKARAVDLIKENGSIAGAVVRRPDGEYSIRAKVVIAADGVESQVAKWAGIDTTCKPHEVDTCVQYLMTGINNKADSSATQHTASAFDPAYCDFYLGHEIAPRGYAWIFPKGHDTANVGVGIGGNIDGRTAIDYLGKFVEKELPGASILAMVVGCVPVTGTLPELARDGFMVVGDAAHQNDPVSGGGIINSMIAGQIAGEVAGQAARNGDVSYATLAEYQKRWHRQVGRTFRHLRRLREGILKFSDKTLDDIARVLLKAGSKKLSLIDIFWTALRNDPKLLLELRHLISMGWAQ